MSKMLLFSYKWSKLDSDFFTTIRRRKKIEVGEKVKVSVKHTDIDFPAECLQVEPVKLQDIPTPFLCYDTDTHSREAAVDVINSFYKNPILDHHTVYVFLMKKVRV